MAPKNSSDHQSTEQDAASPGLPGRGPDERGPSRWQKFFRRPAPPRVEIASDLRREMNEVSERLRVAKEENDALKAEADSIGREVGEIEELGKDAGTVEAEELVRRHDDLNLRLAGIRNRLGELEKEQQTLLEKNSAIGEQISVREDRLRTAMIESEKMVFEVFKLTATLDAAAVVAVSAVTAALGLEDLHRVYMLYLCYLSLLVSLVCSVGACLNSAARAVGILEPDVHELLRVSELRYRSFFYVSVGGLSTGVAFFIFFMLNNVLR